MTKMDGVSIKRGDTVYDLALGVGQVEYEQLGALIAVSFQDPPRTRNYRMPTGIMVGQTARTLFWSTPTIVAPPRDRSKYDQYSRVIKDMADLIL